MALTTTTISGAMSAGTGAGLGTTTVTLTSFTAPTGLSNLTRAWLLVDSELMLITDTSLAPTLSVVRGHYGTLVAAHSNLAAAQYGVPGDFGAYRSQTIPGPQADDYKEVRITAQAVTATGATGSTAGIITAYPTGFLWATGASGAGINLPVPDVGYYYTIQNATAGALNIFSVGATINGTTGTTAFALTSTGNKMVIASSTTSGAWVLSGNT